MSVAQTCINICLQFSWNLIPLQVAILYSFNLINEGSLITFYVFLSTFVFPLFFWLFSPQQIRCFSYVALVELWYPYPDMFLVHHWRVFLIFFNLLKLAGVPYTFVGYKN